MTRHPDHDTIAEEVLGWYTRSWPEIGYLAEERSYGLLRFFPNGGGEVVVRDAGDVPTMLDEIAERYPNGKVSVSVHGRDTDARVGRALTAAGLVRTEDNVEMVHVGSPPDDPGVAGLTIDVARSEDELRTFSVVQLKGFADSENEPAAEAIDNELMLRRAELGGDGHFLIGRLNGGAVSICGTHTSDVVSIFLLATRVPFRRRRIATALLCHVLRPPRRFVAIGCDPSGRPIQLYRSLGFTHEVFWRRRYALPSGS